MIKPFAAYKRKTRKQMNLKVKRKDNKQNLIRKPQGLYKQLCNVLLFSLEEGLWAIK